MFLPLAAALAVLAASQASGAAELPVPPDAEPEPDRSEVPAESPEGSRPGAVEIDGAAQAGIPFLPDLSAGRPIRPGVALDLGVMSELWTQTMTGTGGDTIWGSSLNVTPGVGLEAASPTIKLAGGYAARFTVPTGFRWSELAILHSATLRTDWRLGARWTAGLAATGTYGDYSQLQPAATPGGPGAPPPALNPVRSFATFPYLALNGVLRIATQLSTRSRLRASIGYIDVGGIGTTGQAAQPRTWGPSAEAAYEWDASRHASLTTAASFQDSRLVDDFSVQVGTLTQTWTQTWSTDFRTTVAGGAALTSTESTTFLTVGHLLPVAAIGGSYQPDARRSVSLGLDFALAPYVDVYSRVAYQRASARAGFDWRPASALLVSVYVAAALVPYRATAPESYGTTGASLGWGLGKLFTLSFGGFSQTQIQGGTAGGGAFRQWTTYVSLSLRDRVSL